MSFSVLVAVGTSAMLDYRFGPYDRRELKTAEPMLQELRPEDLLLADRAFPGSPQLARIRARGAQFLMRKNPRLIVERLPVLRRLGRDDFLIEIPMSKPARQKDPSLPETVRLRSKTVENVYKEVAAHVLAYQLVRRIVAQAARKHRIEPPQISFLGAARWVISFSARMAVLPTWRLPQNSEPL